jgi:hypothetical protein
MAEDYPYGGADSIPHIHRYSGGDCHLKITYGRRIQRFDLIVDGRKNRQGVLDEAFDAVRDAYPVENDHRRVELLRVLKSLLHNCRPHIDEA